jgi:hypothetical protein
MLTLTSFNGGRIIINRAHIVALRRCDYRNIPGSHNPGTEATRIDTISGIDRSYFVTETVEQILSLIPEGN